MKVTSLTGSSTLAACLRKGRGVHVLAAAAASTHWLPLYDIPHLIVSVEQRHGTERDKCRQILTRRTVFAVFLNVVVFFFLRTCYIQLRNVCLSYTSHWRRPELWIKLWLVLSHSGWSSSHHNSARRLSSLASFGSLPAGPEHLLLAKIKRVVNLVAPAYFVIGGIRGVGLVLGRQQETHGVVSGFPKGSVTIIHLHENRSCHVYFLSLK